MAIGHIAVRAHSRANGHSAAAALAYRFGCALTCSRTGERHDFSRRSQREEVMACDLTPGPFADVAALARAIEDAERRKNSTICRDVQIALPAELDAPARAALAERFAGELAQRYGTVAAWAVHRPDRRSDARNHHAHIVLPTRSLDGTGFGKKIRILDDRKRGPAEIKAIRARWEETANAALIEAGLDSRVHTGRTTNPAPTLGATHTAIERRAWSERHSGRTPPAMGAARLVLDDGRCATGRGRRLARHESTRALLADMLGRHVARSVPVRDAAAEPPKSPTVALQPVREPRPAPEARPRSPTVHAPPAAAPEPVRESRPVPEARPRSPTVHAPPAAASEPVREPRPAPEARPRSPTVHAPPAAASEPVRESRPVPEARPRSPTVHAPPAAASEPVREPRPAPEARPRSLTVHAPAAAASEPVREPRPAPEARPRFPTEPAPAAAASEPVREPRPVPAARPRSLTVPAPHVVASEPVPKARPALTAQPAVLTHPRIIDRSISQLWTRKMIQESEAVAADRLARQTEAARSSLTAALTADAVEAVGVALIREAAGCRACPYLQGIGSRARAQAVAEVSKLVQRFEVAACHRFRPSMTARQLESHHQALDKAIAKWRKWWRRQVDTLLVELVRTVSPVHLVETEELNSRAEVDLGEHTLSGRWSTRTIAPAQRRTAGRTVSTTESARPNRHRRRAPGRND